MTKKEKIFRQLMWDYSISHEEVDQVFSGKKDKAGHYTREQLFIKMLETYPWFTIVEIFTPEQIKSMLTDKVVSKLRMPSLRSKYDFIKKRLQENLQAAG